MPLIPGNYTELRVLGGNGGIAVQALPRCFLKNKQTYNRETAFFNCTLVKDTANAAHAMIAARAAWFSYTNPAKPWVKRDPIRLTHATFFTDVGFHWQGEAPEGTDESNVPRGLCELLGVKIPDSPRAAP